MNAAATAAAPVPLAVTPPAPAAIGVALRATAPALAAIRSTVAATPVPPAVTPPALAAIGVTLAAIVPAAAATRVSLVVTPPALAATASTIAATPPATGVTRLTIPATAPTAGAAARSHATGAITGRWGGMRNDDAPVTTIETPPASDAGGLRDAHFARVASAEVRAAVRGRLRLRRVSPQEIDDLAGEVQVALLAMADFPATQAACLAAARDVADKRVVSRIRRVNRRARVVVGLTAKADEHAGDTDALPVAPAAFVREERHRVLEASLTDGTVDARTTAMLRLQAQGRSIGEIAARLGVAAKTVRNTLVDGRRGVRAAWDTRAARLGLT